MSLLFIFFGDKFSHHEPLTCPVCAPNTLSGSVFRLPTAKPLQERFFEHMGVMFFFLISTLKNGLRFDPILHILNIDQWPGMCFPSYIRYILGCPPLPGCQWQIKVLLGINPGGDCCWAGGQPKVYDNHGFFQRFATVGLQIDMEMPLCDDNWPWIFSTFPSMSSEKLQSVSVFLWDLIYTYIRYCYE